jgi:hypothetical protein
MHEIRPSFLLLEMLLAEDEPLVPKRFVDPHGCGSSVVAGYGLRILYADSCVRIPIFIDLECKILEIELRRFYEIKM